MNSSAVFILRLNYYECSLLGEVLLIKAQNIIKKGYNVGMNELERMNKGLLHNFINSPEMDCLKQQAKDLLLQFNDPCTSPETRQMIQKELFGTMDGYCLIMPPFRCEYGRFIHMGRMSFINYDCMVLDGCDIRIGSNVYIGPRTIISTASHPVYAPVRVECYGIHEPITIEDNVWIGAGCIILPGAHIGRNSVIAAGSIVVKKHPIPSDCIAYGNPCKVARQIQDSDKQYWEALKAEYLESEGIGHETHE